MKGRIKMLETKYNHKKVEENKYETWKCISINSFSSEIFFKK